MNRLELRSRERLTLRNQWITGDSGCVMLRPEYLGRGRYRFARLCSGQVDEAHVGHVQVYDPSLAICPRCVLSARADRDEVARRNLRIDTLTRAVASLQLRMDTTANRLREEFISAMVHVRANRLTTRDEQLLVIASQLVDLW